MIQPLENFCERELVFLEETVAAFARRYPAQAKHLVPEPGQNADPHLERFIEGFALLAGRVRHKLDADFPELTESLLQILYPHLELVIPSMAIAQAQVKATPRELCRGWRLEQGTPVRGFPLMRKGAVQPDTYCRYRLGYPLTIWPVELKRASFENAPFEAVLTPPPNTVAVLRLQFACQEGVPFDDLALDKLRLYLSGPGQLIAGLHETIFNRCLGVAFTTLDGTAAPLVLPAEQCLGLVGLDLDEALLPLPAESFVGYGLLMELLSFPQKFQFADLGGWPRLRGQGFGSQVEVLMFFSHSQENLGLVSARNFLLGCAPVVNLFPQSAEPIDYHHMQPGYRVVPLRSQPLGMEVYRVESVRSMDEASRKFIDFHPFYARGFGQADERLAYWHATRRESTLDDDAGTEVHLTLIDRGFHPAKFSDAMLDVRVLCTNRDMPHKFQQANDVLFIDSPQGSEGVLKLLHKPTHSLRPPLRRASYWRLMGQNSLNHVSLVQGKVSVEALQEMLRLCDFSGPLSPQLSAVNEQIIDGIRSIRSRSIMGQTSCAGKRGACRGTEVQIEFDEHKYVGTGVFLVSAVLDRYLGLYTAVNSFTKLMAKTAQAEGYLRVWPARAGAHELPR